MVDTVAALSADSQLMMAPSLSRPAMRNIPSQAPPRESVRAARARDRVGSLDVEGVVGLGDLLAAERGLEERTMSGPAGTAERDSVPLHDDVGGRADAEHETPGAAEQSGDRLGEQGRPTYAEDRRTEPHHGVRPPEGKRGDSIGPHRFGRPQIGVASPLEPLVAVSLLMKLKIVEGNRHAIALHRRILALRSGQCHTPSA